ncbi:MAG: hypothetical protein ACXVPY_13755 [Bacteroidia bacterium]
MSISIVILGIVLGGILTIVSLIFAILAMAGGKTQNAIIWGLSFLIAICILVLSIVQVIKRVGEKVKNGIEWAKEHDDKGLTCTTAGEKSGLYQQEQQYFIDTLKKYTNENLKNKVPEDFYSKKIVKDDGSYVFPFVFPLNIKYNNETFLGDFINYENDSTYLKNVSQMAFDENFAIVKTDNKNDPETIKAGHAEIEYILFDLRTREYLPFSNREQLLEKADKIGYSGTTSMNYLSDDYKAWIESVDLDK